MKIGSQAQRSSAISASNAETIVVRGRDLCRELVGTISFTDHMWLLVTGQLPGAAQRRVLDATLVAIAEHGLVPSVAASRMTLAAAPEALQGAVAAGILGCGSVILGSAECRGAAVCRHRGRACPRRRWTRRRARCSVKCERRASRCPATGIRCTSAAIRASGRLLAVATEAGVAGRHIEIAGAGRATGAGDLGQAAGDECLGRDRRGAAGCRLSAARGQGRADAGAHRQPHRASDRRAAAADRIRARRLGRRAPSTTTARAPDGFVPGERLSGARMTLQAVLRGVKIVEQGTFITGPCAGMMLADLGADVIKVESPGGDPYRAYQGGLYSPHFQAYNRNKRSIVCDLKQARRSRAVRAADRRRRRLHPELPSGHGREARRRAGSGCASSIRGWSTARSAGSAPTARTWNGRAMTRWRRRCQRIPERGGGSGAAALSRSRRWPMPSPASTPRYGVLGALFERASTGRGRLVEVSMLEAMAHFAVEPFAAFFALGAVPKSSRSSAPGAGLHPAHRRTKS